MKIIGSIFKIIGALIFLAIIAIVLCIGYASIDRTDTFYLKNADFINYDLLIQEDEKLKEYDPDKKIQPSVYVHRISTGTGAIMAYRWYSNRSLIRIDDEGFKKITIWISKIPAEYPTTVNLSDSALVKVAFTQGGSAWPEAACSGYIKTGTIKLNKKGSAIIVTIDGDLIPIHSHFAWNGCIQQKLNLNFSAKEINFSNLTPWLGLPGDHSYNETYR